MRRSSSSPTSRIFRARSAWSAKSGSATCGSGSRRPSFQAAKRNASSWRPSCSERSAARRLYVLDEPTTGLHAEDINKLMTQLDGLVESGNTVIVVEHDMRVVACERLRHRHRARRGRGGRPRGGGRNTAKCRALVEEQDRAFPREGDYAERRVAAIQRGLLRGAIRRFAAVGPQIADVVVGVSGDRLASIRVVADQRADAFDPSAGALRRRGA